MADVKTVNLLIEAFKNNRVKVDYCDILKNSDEPNSVFKIVQYLSSGSSGTQITFAKLLKSTFELEGIQMEGIVDYPVFSKIFPDIDALKENGYRDEEVDIDSYARGIGGLEYELVIYRDVVSRMIKQSPNFVPYLGSAKCVLNGEINRNLYRNYLETLRASDTADGTTITILEKLNEIPVNILLTGRAGSDISFTGRVESFTRFNDRLRVSGLGLYTDEILNQIFFQLIFSINVMVQHRLIHNDLSTSNIMILDVGEGKSITRYYKCYGRTFKIQTRFVPYIFDWDLSFCEGIGKNPKLIDNTLCGSYDICNIFNDKKDLYLSMYYAIDVIFNTANFPYLLNIQYVMQQSQELFRIPYFRISLELAQHINALPTYDDGLVGNDPENDPENNPKVFKIGKDILDAILAPYSHVRIVELLNFVRSLSTAIVSLEERATAEGTKYLVKFEKGYDARLPFTTDILPTPEIILRNPRNFMSLEVRDVDIPENAEVYSL